MNVWKLLSEPLKVHGLGTDKEIRDRVLEMLERIGLTEDQLER